MVLKNFHRIMAGLLLGSGAMKFVNYQGSEKTYTNSSITGPGVGLRVTSICTYATYNGNGVVFGDGNTPVTIDDYKLSGNVITTLSGSAETTYEEGSDKASSTRTFTLKNTGTAEITIKEVATLAGINYQTIIERTVLDEPVTIPAGGFGQVTYTICMNYPAA